MGSTPAGPRGPGRAWTTEAAGLHRFCEARCPLERAGDERRDEPCVAAHAGELDAAPANGLAEPGRVTLERRDEASCERDRERRAPSERDCGDEPVVVEQKRVDSEGEPDGSQPQAVD